MKTYIYLFLLLLATASCSEQTAPDHSVGYLRVENIILSCDTETLPITRAVDAGLKLEIWQGSECVRSYDPGAAELSKKIVLPVGEYTLRPLLPIRPRRRTMNRVHPSTASTILSLLYRRMLL